MRVRDLVAEPLVVNQRVDRRKVDRKVARVLEDVGLRPEQANNFPHEFSGGQRQRIAIASALISNPRLIVLDEHRRHPADHRGRSKRSRRCGTTWWPSRGAELAA